MALVFEQIITEGMGDASYLVGDDGAGTAALIDPLADVARYIDAARRHGIVITHVFESHVHEDFASGAQALARQVGGATVCVSAHDAPDYGFAHRAVRDGDRFTFGKTVLTARHTPGHTPEHLSYLVAGTATPDEPFAVLSGGSLLAGSAGRADLLGARQAKALARAQFRTLHEVLLALPDGVQVFPTHVHGSPCGASIGERSSTTIGHERRHNPLLQCADEAAFVRAALDGLPPKPVYYPRLKKTNTRGDAAPEVSPVPPLLPDAFEAASRSGAVPIVDARDQLAFGGGHIEGAVNIGAGGKLSIWAGWMIDPRQALLLVLPADGQLPDVLRQFRRTGFHRFSGYLAGSMAAWQKAGKPLRAMQQLPVHQLAQQLTSRAVLDVRAPDEWAKGHIPGARHVFLPELPAQMAKLDAQRPWAVYCDSGYRASIAASLLQRHGFADVASVPGSWQAWVAAGLPVEG
jgi:hydroxyacylglutathione hydrolase